MKSPSGSTNFMESTDLLIKMSKKNLADFTIESLFEGDVDNNGKLSKHEIKKYFEKTKQAGEKEVTQADVDAFMASVD